MKNKKTLSKIILFFIFLFVLISCKNANKTNNKDPYNGKISISGAFALYPLTVKWAEEYKKLHPNVTIDISAGGAGKGMTDALNKMVDLGMYSKSVSEEEKQKGAWSIAVAKDAVLATVSVNNPDLMTIKSKGINIDKLFDIFITNKLNSWGLVFGTSSKQTINVYTRSDACGAGEMWAKFLKGKKQEDIQGVGINGDPGVAEALKKDPNGIGYNNIAYIYDINTKKKYDGIDVVPIDLNGNGKIDTEENFYNDLNEIIVAIKDGRYPSPPSRDLYFVAKGAPESPLVKSFLNWILTDGQKYVNESGYVLLKEEGLKVEKEKIK